jgi:hypothetical protein
VRKSLVAIVLILAAVVAAALRFYFNLSIPISIVGGAVVIIIPLWGYFGFKTVIKLFMHTIGGAWHTLMYIWPIGLLAAAYFVPVLHLPAQVDVHTEALAQAFVLSMAGAVFVLASAVTSSLYDAKQDIMINLITSIVWLAIIATVNERVGWQYWTVIPLIASFAECIADAFEGTQNAWNKNPTQAAITSGRIP